MTVYQSLITVTTAGTPIPVTLPTGAPAGSLFCRMEFRAAVGNSGAAAVGLGAFTKSSDAGLLQLLTAPTANVTHAMYQVDSIDGTNSLDCTAFSVDVQTSGQKVAVNFFQK